MRCNRRWCWKKYQRVAHVYVRAGDVVVRFGQWLCRNHADEADERARRFRHDVASVAGEKTS